MFIFIYVVFIFIYVAFIFMYVVFIIIYVAFIFMYVAFIFMYVAFIFMYVAFIFMYVAFILEYVVSNLKPFIMGKLYLKLEKNNYNANVIINFEITYKSIIFYLTTTIRQSYSTKVTHVGIKCGFYLITVKFSSCMFLNRDYSY